VFVLGGVGKDMSQGGERFFLGAAGGGGGGGGGVGERGMCVRPR